MSGALLRHLLAREPSMPETFVVTYSQCHEALTLADCLCGSRSSCRCVWACIPRRCKRCEPLCGKDSGFDDVAECEPISKRVFIVRSTASGLERWVARPASAASGDVSAVGHGCGVEKRESPARCFRLVDPRSAYRTGGVLGRQAVPSARPDAPMGSAKSRGR